LYSLAGVISGINTFLLVFIDRAMDYCFKHKPAFVSLEQVLKNSRDSEKTQETAAGPAVGVQMTVRNPLSVLDDKNNL
jgi:hypothetical protein